MTDDQRPGLVSEATDRATESGDSVLTPDVNLTAGAKPASGAPDLGEMGEAIDKPRSRSVEATLLTVLAVLYTLSIAREFLVPIVFALLLNFLLSPLIRRLVRWRVPPAIGAAVIVLLCLSGIFGAVYELSGPAQRLVATAPQSLARAQERLREVIKPMQQVSRNVDRAAESVGGGAAKTEVVVQSGPSLSSRIFGTTQRLAAAILEVFVLLYFLLAGGDLFLQKLIKVLPHFSDKVKAVEIARATEAAVSAYLTTAVLVNIGEGLLVAAVLKLQGLPNVLLWGALVVCFELVPYLGALALTGLLTIAGISAFPDLFHALLVPASFLVINLIQGNVVTPMLLGHRLTLNPVAIFIGLTFFFWIWGVPGAFIAVPLLATFKIFCDNIESLAAIGEFLGQRDDDERRVVARVGSRENRGR